MNVDWQVRFGDILVLLSFIIGGIAFMFRTERSVSNSITALTNNVTMLSSNMDAFKDDLKELKVIQKEIAGLLVKVAVQQASLDSLAKRQDVMDMRIEDIRRGRGLIVVEPRDRLPDNI